MPTFCRHNRFIERCPICSKTLPGQRAGGRRARRAAAAPAPRAARRRRAPRRAERPTGCACAARAARADDGYCSPLVPGLRASADAARLAEEIAFSSARLRGARGRRRPAPTARGRRAPRRATSSARPGSCFLLAYLSPLEDERARSRHRRCSPPRRPTPSARRARRAARRRRRSGRAARTTRPRRRTLLAYAQWARARRRAAGRAFSGDAGWTPERRFERLFERLALPGLRARGARYELLVSLGRLGRLRAAGRLAAPAPARVAAPARTRPTLAAKRVFGIGDPLLLDRRAARARRGGRRAAGGARPRALQLGRAASARRSASARRPTPDAAARAAALGL